MKTNLEHIGVGTLWGERAPKDPEHPPVFVPGTPVGQYLTVVRPVRLTEGRILYLVDNHTSKWNRRFCWNCGHKYSPNTARCCEYCQTPLKDLRFLMSARWRREYFEAFQRFAKLRIRHRGIISPRAVLVKAGQMLVVNHYHDEILLVDVAAPVPGSTLLRWAYRLADALAYLHQRGVILGPIRRSNVAIMPDGSARLWDLDVLGVAEDPTSLRQHPDQPISRDVRSLGATLLSLADPLDTITWELLSRAARGEVARPYDLCDAIAEVMGQEQTQTLLPASALSDVGLTRAINEDSWGWSAPTVGVQLYVVADGMGGHSAGEVASAAAVAGFIRAVEEQLRGKRPSLDRVERAMIAGMEQANAAVLQERTAVPGSDMGTTLVAAATVQGSLVLVSAGDSRAYLLRRRSLQQLTQDHSVVGEMLAQKRLTPEQAANHPLAHTLLVWVGQDEDLDFDHSRLQISRGDRLLLCTDGLTDRVDDERIRAVLAEVPDRDDALTWLLRDALYYGGHDNTTMLLVDF